MCVHVLGLVFAIRDSRPHEVFVMPTLALLLCYC